MKPIYMDDFKRWCKEHPNPLDLSEIKEHKFMQRGEYYYEVKAMSEYSSIFRQQIAFIGVSICKYDYEKDTFVVVGGKEAEQAEMKIKDDLIKMSGRTGITWFPTESRS